MTECDTTRKPGELTYCNTHSQHLETCLRVRLEANRATVQSAREGLADILGVTQSVSLLPDLVEAVRKKVVDLENKVGWWAQKCDDLNTAYQKKVAVVESSASHYKSALERIALYEPKMYMVNKDGSRGEQILMSDKGACDEFEDSRPYCGDNPDTNEWCGPCVARAALKNRTETP